MSNWMLRCLAKLGSDITFLIAEITAALRIRVWLPSGWGLQQPHSSFKSLDSRFEIFGLVSGTASAVAEKLRFEAVREGHEFTRGAKSLKMGPRFSAARPPPAAKRRKNAAHGVSRGSKVELQQVPKGRKNSSHARSSAPEGCPHLHVSHCNFAYSALACLKIGISESASFQMIGQTISPRTRVSQRCDSAEKRSSQ